MRITPGITYKGRISEFGGPKDRGVRHDEGLALFNSDVECPEMFLKEAPNKLSTDEGWIPEAPTKALGLARRLDPENKYCACRWDYKITPKPILRRSLVMISANGKRLFARPVDWGPHEDTERLIDCSPSVLQELGVKTDDTVSFVLMVPEELEKRGLVV